MYPTEQESFLRSFHLVTETAPVFQTLSSNKSAPEMASV
jgi:hypothetical protein